ncbi:putative T7SS-secreted protein [Streptomyces solincola]|uniref:putative T7SS-secreted protein n=1 Tax=Streptomyces solincola TaxID=2100817 RepID=UPI0015E47A10|nr:hypothetical protein [Streptomyces solincola]
MAGWEGFKDLAGEVTDQVVDTVDHGIDKGKEFVGEGVDWTTDKVGGGLRTAGHAGLAETVEDWGDETASSLGAEVGEKELGQTDDAEELIHGKPGEIGATVRNLRDFQRAYDLVGAGLRRIDSSPWKGEAAEAFRDKLRPLPADWLHAADAFEDAAKALESYALALAAAQGKAREAIALYQEGTVQSEAAVTAYNKKVDAYNAARNGDDPLPHPGEFSDPGTAKVKRAHAVLAAARRARDGMAETATSMLIAAMAHAPREPTGREKLKRDFIDHSLNLGVEGTHLAGGVVKGTAGLVGFVRSLLPVDPYNITHPAEYTKGVNTTLAGLVSSAANPDRVAQNTWEAAKGDPMEFFGRLLPEAVGPKGVGLVRTAGRAGMARAPAGQPPTRPLLPSTGKSSSHTGDPLDNLTSRGAGGELPAFEEVKRAVMESSPQVVERKWPDDDGRYYATRVLEGGRPDGETVLAGHGYYEHMAGEVTVPEGTTVSFYIPHGERIPGLNGVAVEGGSYPGHAVETFGPGDRIPNYTLAPPEAKGPGGFTVYENSSTVAQRTKLAELLTENMGNVHWAACREFK